MSDDGPRQIEFVCESCGRKVVHFGIRRPFRCCPCMTMPGWYRDPGLAKRIDPDYQREDSE